MGLVFSAKSANSETTSAKINELCCLQEEISKLLEESEHIAMRRKEASEMLQVCIHILNRCRVLVLQFRQVLTAP